MSRKSVREGKNVYQLSREKAGLTRDAAAERLIYVTADRIEKIEYETSLPRPDEVLAMAKGYGNVSLCNHYCSHDCPIGREYVPAVEVKDLSQITLEMLANLNALEKEKNRLIEITVDGEITADEMPDYLRIRKYLDQMELTIESLKMWIEQNVNSDNL